MSVVNCRASSPRPKIRANRTSLPNAVGNWPRVMRISRATNSASMRFGVASASIAPSSERNAAMPPPALTCKSIPCAASASVNKPCCASLPPLASAVIPSENVIGLSCAAFNARSKIAR